MKLLSSSETVLVTCLLLSFNAFSMQPEPVMVTNLHAAIDAKNVAEVKRLLASGADPNAVDNLGRTAIDIANEIKNVDILKVLVDAMSTKQLLDYLKIKFPDFKSFSKGGQTALHLAVSTVNSFPEKRDLIDLVINEGADINAREKVDDFWTALHWAAAQGNKDLVIQLLALGADPLIKDRKSRTPGGIARLLNFKEVAETLDQAMKKI